jgi:integrase
VRGSVRRRGRSWRAVIDLPHGEGGRRRQRTATFPTRREAEEWLARVATEAGKGVVVDPGRLTVGEYLSRWLETSAPSLKPTTVSAYRTEVGRWLRLIGHLPADKVSGMQVQMAVNQLAEHLAPATVRHAYGVLRTAMRQGVEWGVLGRNPCSGVRLPRLGHREMQCWSEVEAAQFLHAIRGRTRHETLFRFALATGMRIGELLGLRWDDVDWTKSEIRVVRSLSWPSGGQPELVDPKTQSGRRVIAVDPATLEALRSHRKRQATERLKAGSAWHDLGLVFSRRDGGYLSYRDLHRLLAANARRAGVPRIRIHDLRHTHATILLRAGRNVKEVADRLGHNDPSVTLRVYSHVLPDQRVEAARVIARVLDGEA